MFSKPYWRIFLLAKRPKGCFIWTHYECSNMQQGINLNIWKGGSRKRVCPSISKSVKLFFGLRALSHYDRVYTWGQRPPNLFGPDVHLDTVKNLTEIIHYRRKLRTFYKHRNILALENKFEYDEINVNEMKLKMTVRGTMLRSEVCNSWCFCLES